MKKLLCVLMFGLTFSQALIETREYIINLGGFEDNLEAINKLTESYIKGSSNFGLSLICKHFPGHGYVKPDTHKSVAVDNRQIKTIFENDIQAFINAIENKIQGVMMSHVIYKKFDILPSSLSPKWNKFLREEIRFNGIVIADDLSMRGLDEYGDIIESMYQSA